MKKTLVLGASPNPERYAYAAVKQLVRYGHEVVAIGNRAGEIDGIAIAKDTPPLDDIHTVSLYLSATNQHAYYDYTPGINRRLIFLNPGKKNPDRWCLPREGGMEPLPACTLVMLSIGNY